MNKTLKEWANEQYLTPEQTTRLEAVLNESVQRFKRITNDPIYLRSSLKKIARLQSILTEFHENDRVVLAILGCLMTGKNEDLIKKEFKHVEFSFYTLSQSCVRAREKYSTSKASKGGAPERIFGRQTLANEVAIIMTLLGLKPRTTPDGAFDGLLRIAFSLAGIYSDEDPSECDKDLKQCRDKAVSQLRQPPPKNR